MTDKYHDPKGGLSAEGRKKFKKSDGANLKPGVKSYDSASTADKKRWISWAKRFAGNPQPLKKDNGEPTNYALMFQAWGRPIPKSAADVKATYDLAVRRGNALEKQKSFELADIAARTEAAAAKPLNQKLYDEVVAAAKKKFSVYPSFYANSWVVQEYKRRGGKFAGSKPTSDKPAFLKSAQAPTEADPDSEEKERIEVTEPVREDEPESARYYSKADRAKYAKSGVAMPDGKWPIPDGASLKDAVGWAKTAGQREHLIKRARALGLMNLLPDAWKNAPTAPGRAKAFVTEYAGKTLLTGPATAITGGFDKTLSENPHMLWMQGRLVGGETPNRNKALWTSGDLELGNATVAHGPLNWLHEARHVIGSIAGSRFVNASQGHQLAMAETAAETQDPHIVAAASIWRWLYPDEAMVVEQASSMNQLWYSMECVAEKVICSGEDGCGTEIGYVEYATDERAGCEHIQARNGIRRFANPTFLGAAVIVPPTRPGWADADARVMQHASWQAEKAYEQAGEPDVNASDFEQIVAQVLKFAQ